MSESTTLDKIRQQSDWYGEKARGSRRVYVALKIVQIIMAASIPVVSVASGGDPQRWINALLGAFIGIIEAVLQLGQYQQNWLLYRATKEALRREDFLYSARAGPYAGQSDPDGTYAVRADAIMSGENSKWLSAQEQQRVKQPQTGGN